MSGGFFRGTTADQDTRFSNKHAKLLKSQKFPAELETLVDMTKVKMDVMRPWIAHRVTELLGFEDEVLINFIYGLLEEKVVNGKEIQISLTGFMEKNTGKFMKELWTHLLSAQQNASGVPQQFLDAKEEETRKKQEDMDRITRELKRTKEKESRELEQERMKRTKEKEGWELEEEITKMEREVGNVKAATLEPHSRSDRRVSSTRSADEKGTNESNGSKGMTRISRSPHSADHSLSPPRGRRSRSISKSANSESPSRSRSLSASPKPVRHSVSSEKRRPSLSRRSLTPRRVDSRRRSPSPLSHSYIRSPLPARRRFRSPMRRRSRSPLRRRSRTPIRRRSRTPIRRRSRTPIRRRSRTPIRRRSRTPIRRRPRSPFQYRSPSPFRPRSRSSSSPSRHISRSPMRSRSPPVRRQSRSPIRRRYRRAPSTPPRHRSPSPVRRGAAFSGRRRSPSPGSMSSSPSGRVSLSPKHGAPPSLVRRGSPKRRQGSPMRSPRDGHRIVQKNAPGSPRKVSPERFAEGCKKSSFLVNPPPASVRSSERDPKGRRISHNEEPALSPSPYNSPSSSGSPPPARRSPSVERSPIPPKRQRESMNTNDRLDSVEVEERTFSRGKEDKRENKEPVNDKYDKKKYSPERLASYRSSEIQAHNKKSNDDDGRKHYSEMTEESLRSRDRARNSGKEYKADKMNDLRPNLSQKFQRINNSNRSGSPDSGSEESDEKRKHKRSKRKDAMSDIDYSHDSHSEDKKEAKKRRREEKKLKKEEKRKRREERRRKRDDRRTEKLKLKAVDNYDSDNEDALSDQKKLEIELREKALESLRAKKGIGH